MKIVKSTGKSTWVQRRMTMHDSTAEWRLQVSNGKFNRATEKPGNKFTTENDNIRSRGSKGPRRL